MTRSVIFQGKRAELHLSKFGNGISGKSIRYKGEWMTPQDYEQVPSEVRISAEFILVCIKICSNF